MSETALATPSTEQVLLQQAHLLVSQQQQLNQLRAEVEQIQQGSQSTRLLGQPKPAPAMPANPALIRQAVNRRVNEYCGYHNVLQHDTWTFVYKQLRYECGIDLYRIRRTGRESLLDVAERSGHLPRLYELVIKELGLPEE